MKLVTGLRAGATPLLNLHKGISKTEKIISQQDLRHQGGKWCKVNVIFYFWTKKHGLMKRRINVNAIAAKWQPHRDIFKSKDFWWCWYFHCCYTTANLQVSSALITIYFKLCCIHCIVLLCKSYNLLYHLLIFCSYLLCICVFLEANWSKYWRITYYVLFARIKLEYWFTCMWLIIAIYFFLYFGVL